MTGRASRLDIRTTQQAKSTIESAAGFLGITTTSFIMECAMDKATKVLEQAQMIQLNESEGRRFIALLGCPPKPNESLRRLFEEHSPEG